MKHGKEKLVHLETIDSTNLFALKNFAEFADGTLIIADSQTNGRGRRGRKWISPPANIYASYVIKKQEGLAPVCASWIGCLASLNTLRSFAPKSDFWIKWPNDVFSGSKKISGVLCESHSAQNSNRVDGMIIGMGVDVNLTPKDIENAGISATSLFIETGKKTDIAKFAEILHDNLLTLSDMDQESLYEIWKRENRLLGKKILVRLENGEEISGIFKDIAEDGRLVLRIGQSRNRYFSSGDVSLEIPTD